MRHILFLAILFSSAVRPCLADMNWEHLTLRQSTKDQSQAITLLKKGLYDIQYDATRTVEEFIHTHPDREGRLKNLLYDHKTTQYYLTDGTIEYRLELSLKPEILALLLPTTQPTQLVVPMLCPYCGQEWPAGKKPPEGLQLKPKEIVTIDYTGIIIDCRGLNLAPSLFPRLLTETFEEVYSINFADTQYLVERGLVTYINGDVYDNTRIGYNPLRINALATVGDKPTDIKISSADAQRIHGSKNNLSLLRECRVAIIFGQ